MSCAFHPVLLKVCPPLPRSSCVFICRYADVCDCVREILTSQFPVHFSQKNSTDKKKEKRKDLEFPKKKTYFMHNFFAIYDWQIYIFISFSKIWLEQKGPWSCFKLMLSMSSPLS